jgi:hypothetical protein
MHAAAAPIYLHVKPFAAKESRGVHHHAGSGGTRRGQGGEDRRLQLTRGGGCHVEAGNIDHREDHQQRPKP